MYSKLNPFIVGSGKRSFLVRVINLNEYVLIKSNANTFLASLIGVDTAKLPYRFLFEGVELVENNPVTDYPVGV